MVRDSARYPSQPLNEAHLAPVSADALSPLTIVPRWLNPPLYGPSSFRFEGFDFCCKQFCASAQRAIELQRLCD